MTDREQIETLIVCRHPYMFTRTVEERYVSELLSEIAVNRGLGMWLWSISQDVSDGLLSNSVLSNDQIKESPFARPKAPDFSSCADRRAYPCGTGCGMTLTVRRARNIGISLRAVFSAGARGPLVLCL